MPPSAQVITKQIESTNEQRKTFHLDANAHFLFYPLLAGSSRFWTEQAGTAAGGLSGRQMSSDRRSRALSSGWDEVVCLQHRTLTLTFICSRGLAATL